MINKPVKLAVSTDEETDLDWFIIMDKNNIELSKENYQKSVAMINMHDDLIAALTEIARISDRKHDAWDKAHELLKLAEEIK